MSQLNDQTEQQLFNGFTAESADELQSQFERQVYNAYTAAGGGSGGGGGASPSTTVPLPDAGNGAVGTSARYARADHVHPATGSDIEPADTDPLPNAPTADIGTSEKYARADHVHPDTGGGGDATYTSSEPSLIAVGGLEVGFTAPDGISFQDFADQMLHPYQAPAFTAFAISGAKTFEVGETFAANPSFTFSVSNSANIKANTLKIEDTTSGLTLLENGSVSSPKSTTRDAITKTAAGSHGFKITATNSKNSTFNRTASLSWQWAVYSGTSASTSLDSAGVVGLANKKLASGGAGTYALAAGGYKYFCIPASFTQPSKFTNADNGFGVAMESPQTLDVTNAYGVTVSYKVYRTTFELGGSLNLKVE